jgi:uncharacterized membrane protein YhhN
LLGHVLFIAVFLKGQSDALSTWVLPAWWPVLALHAIVMLVWLLPRTGKLAPAVLVYVLAIFFMALAAGGLSPAVGLHGKPLVLLGALLFVLSDTILAIDRFVKPLAAGHGLVLLTYYSALWCIVVGSSG